MLIKLDIGNFPGFEHEDFSITNTTSFWNVTPNYKDITKYHNAICDSILEFVSKHLPFSVLRYELVTPKVLLIKFDVTKDEILFQLVHHEDKIYEEIFEYIYWDDWDMEDYHEAILTEFVNIILYKENFYGHMLNIITNY